MKRTSRVAVVVAGLVSVALVGSPPADAAPAPQSPETYVGGGYGTVVTDASGNALAVAGRGFETANVHFRYRHIGGRWSGQYNVPGLGGSYRAAASGQVGMPLVVGSLKGSDRAGVVAVIRRADAGWTPPVRLDAGLGGYPTGVDAAGNADGDFAVAWTMATGANAGSTYAAIRQRGGSWHTSLVGRASDVSFGSGPQPRTTTGIDSPGNVTVARTVTSTGSSTHRLLLRRKPVTGAWQRQRQVSAAGRSVRWHDLVIEPTGRETVAYQLVNGASPDYGDSYVLRQASVGGGISQAWHQPASSRPSIAAAGGRLRVVWATVSGTDPAHGHTQAFNPAARPIQDLGADPANFTSVAINKYGAGVVVTGAGTEHVLHPVTATSLGAGRPLQTSDDGSVALHAVLGAGSQYFVAADTRLVLPAGGDFVSYVAVFRGSRS